MIDEALLLGLPSSCGCGCTFEMAVIAASDVLMFFISPTCAAPNHDGDPSFPSLCDATRTGVGPIPRLFALRCCDCRCRAAPSVFPSLRGSIFSGSAGTGGAASCHGRPYPGEPLLLSAVAGLCGLGDLKVFSAMELLLPRLCSAEDGRPEASGAVPAEDRDALRRIVRLVWTSATLVGVAGRARRAAAAAAEERDCCCGSRRLKTAAAAMVALGLAVMAVSGCMVGEKSAHSAVLG